MRQRAPLRSKHIGCPRGMGKVWKVGCRVKNLHAHQGTPFRQGNVSRARPMVKRQMRCRESRFHASLSCGLGAAKLPETAKARNCLYNFRVPSPTLAESFRSLGLLVVVAGDKW